LTQLVPAQCVALPVPQRAWEQVAQHTQVLGGQCATMLPAQCAALPVLQKAWARVAQRTEVLGGHRATVVVPAHYA